MRPAPDEPPAERPAPSPGTPGPGALVAGCVIEGELGRGAMGVVFRARDPQGRAVALKLLLASGNQRQRLERFHREAELTGALSHPGIVSVLGAGVEAGRPCLILELVEGTDLEAVFSDPAAEPDTKLRLVEEVARAIDYAHSRGVIHRDLKPANVLVTQDGRARVTDFGLARDIDRQTRLSVTGQGLGTPAYMAPEQAMGQKNTGPATDVYALGVLLFEALTGELPFEASTQMELYSAILRGKPRRPSELSPQVSPGYDALVARALAKDPAKRYASAGEFARELEGLRLELKPQRGGVWPWVALGSFLAGAGAVALVELSASPPESSLSLPGASASSAPSLDSAGGTPQPRAAEVLQRAESLLDNAQLEEALALLERSGHGESPLAKELRAHLAACDLAAEELAKFEHFRQEDYSLAKGWINAALSALKAAEPHLTRSPRALLLLGKLQDYALSPDLAETALTTLISLPGAKRRDETYEGLLILAELKVLKGNLKNEPQDLVARALRLRPDRIDARLAKLGFLSRGEQRKREREALWAEFPNNPRLMSLQGAAIFGGSVRLPIGDPARERGLDQAESLLRSAAAKSPYPGQYLAPLGLVLMVRGRPKESLQSQLRALETSQYGIVGYWWKLGHVARRHGLARRSEEALKASELALRRARIREPSNPLVRCEIGILRWAQASLDPSPERWQAALDTLQAALRECSAHWEANFYLAHCLRNLSARREEAINAFTLAIELSPTHAPSYVGRGMTHLALGSKEEAAADALRALELKPDWKPATDLLERCRR